MTIARGESSPSVIHRDLITARTETRARLDVAFSPRDYRNDAIILHVSYFGREMSAKMALPILTLFYKTPALYLMIYTLFNY